LSAELKKVNKKHDEVKFFLILKICKIHITNYNIREFDHYFEKIEIVDFNLFSKDFIVEFHLLMHKRRTLNKPVEESINFYMEILNKHKKYISEKKLFEIYIQISNSYKDLSNFNEAHSYLDKGFQLNEVQNDKYLLCQYYKFKSHCYSNQLLYNESFELCNTIDKLSLEFNFKDFYYESMALKANYYNRMGQSDLAIEEAEKVLNYGKMSSNNIIIFTICRVLQLCYLKLNNSTKALKYNKMQVNLSKLFFNIKYEIDSRINLCVLLSTMPVRKEMLIEVKKIEELNKLLKDPGTKLRALTLKASYYYLEKDYNTALKYYKMALLIAKRNKFFTLISLITSHIAKANRDLKKFKAAIYNINESIYYLKINNITYDQPRLIFIKARIYYDAGDWVKAQNLIDEAIELAQLYNKSILKICLELEELINKQKML